MRKYQKTPDKIRSFARGFYPKVGREIHNIYQDWKRGYQNTLRSYGGKNVKTIDVSIEELLK